MDTKVKNLDKLKKFLKKKFVGIDHIIDHVIECLTVWYLLPDYQTSPIIINLWGMTGTGKTDLVRTIVNFLKLNDKFIEHDMGEFISANLNDYSVERFLNKIKDFDNSSGIILFDEFQKARTIDEEGREIDRSFLKVLWSLLSDGKVNYFVEWERMYISLNSVLNEKDSYASSYQIKNMMFLLGGEAKANFDKLQKGDKKITQKILDDLQTKGVQRTFDFSKTLIFITGNIDEAYKGLTSIVDQDSISADELHERSLKIKESDIKEALQHRFRMEEIARLGNNHIIYPTLSEKSFKTIIKNKLNEKFNHIEKEYNIKIKAHSSLVNNLYNEGVVASLGTRPIFSTINRIMDSTLPKYILKYRDTGMKVKIKASIDKLKFISDHITRDYPVNFKNMIEKNTLHPEPLNTRVAIHEAGHAVVGFILLESVPEKILSKTVKANAGGMVAFKPDLFKLSTKKDILNELAMSLGGYVAEELKYGKDGVSIGATSDLNNATRKASNLITTAGLGSHLGVSLEDPCKPYNVTSFKEEDHNAVEKLLQEAKKIAQDTLKENKQLHKLLTELLRKQTSVSPEEFKALVKKVKKVA